MTSHIRKATIKVATKSSSARNASADAGRNIRRTAGEAADLAKVSAVFAARCVAGFVRGLVKG